jgi:hypothetical protein
MLGQIVRTNQREMGDMGLAGGLSSIRREVSPGSSRLIYGNDAGRVNNLGKSRQLARLRRQSERPADPLARQLARQLDRLGYAVLDPGYRPGLIQEIQAGYAAIIADPHACVDMGGRIRDVVRYVRDPMLRVPGLREMITPQLADVLDAVYGGRWAIRHARMWRICYLPPDERAYHHYGNLWHCDQHPTTTLKLFVQLSDGVTDEAGAFRFHDVPSTRLIMRAGYLGTGRLSGPARRLAEDPRRVSLFDSRAGLAAFCNTTRCMHRAGVPLREGATRGMLQITFGVGTGPRAARGDAFAQLPPDTDIAEGRYA